MLKKKNTKRPTIKIQKYQWLWINKRSDNKIYVDNNMVLWECLNSYIIETYGKFVENIIYWF